MLLFLGDISFVLKIFENDLYLFLEPSDLPPGSFTEKGNM